jgi:hypothetical protein
VSPSSAWGSVSRFPLLKLRRLGTVTLGKMLAPKPQTDSDREAPYLRAANVQPDGALELADLKEMWFSEQELASLELCTGDVVVVEGGQGGFGRAAFLREGLPGTGFQNSINRVRPGQGDLDGVRDMCSRISRRRRFGEFSDRHYVQSLYRQYSQASEEAWSEESWRDFAYIEACASCLLILLDDDWGYAQLRAEHPDMGRMLAITPRFLVIGANNDLLTEEDFREALKQSTRRAPKVRKRGREVLAGLAEDMTLRSDPFLSAHRVEGSHLANR